MAEWATIPQLGQVDLRKFWPDGGTLPLEPVLIGLGILAVGAALHAGRRYWRRLRPRLEPLRLFHEIASDLGLNWAEQYWLWRVARLRALASPLTLLVCDATLSHHCEAVMRQIPPAARHRLARRQQTIRQRLFHAN